jgi:ureidoacrylate peracid hydrolase
MKLMRGRIEPHRTALVVVDMQRLFLAPDAPWEVPAGRALLPTLLPAIAAARECGMRLVWTQNILPPELADQPTLFDVYPPFDPQPDDIIIHKRRHSAFYDTDLEARLRDAGIRTVAIAGVSTEQCCQATLRDAHYRGLETIVLSDATAAMEYPDRGHGALAAAEVQRTTLILLAGYLADVMTAAAFLARAGPPAVVELGPA